MRVLYLPRARAQLEKIYEHIAADNEHAARLVIARIEYIVELLGENPGLGHIISRKGAQMFPVRPYPYLIYYRVRTDMEILHVRHAARKPLTFQEAARAFER